MFKENEEQWWDSRKIDSSLNFLTIELILVPKEAEFSSLQIKTEFFSKLFLMEKGRKSLTEILTFMLS